VSKAGRRRAAPAGQAPGKKDASSALAAAALQAPGKKDASAPMAEGLLGAPAASFALRRRRTWRAGIVPRCRRAACVEERFGACVSDLNR
jgi:hypothetical protein